MLGNWLVEQIISEGSKVNTVIAIYPGRFQPFGKHHAEVFKWVQNKFGRGNSYIATSDKVALPKSPFSFKEKKKIINKYGFKNVVQVKNPYIATEITDKFDPETTAVVFVVGGKEDNRIKPGKYFRKWEGKAEYGLGEHGYFIESPVISLNIPGYGDMSGTSIRKALGNPALDNDERMDLFKGVFGYSDKTIYKLVTDKLIELNEIMVDFVMRNKLYESSMTLAGGAEVDDGPRGYWGDEHSYRNRGEFEAAKLGMEVLNYLTGQDVSHVYGDYDTDYPDGPVDAVSYFPAGDVDSVGAGTQYIELRGNPAYNAWLKHITRVALRLGYTFVHDLRDKELSVKGSEGEPKEKNQPKVIDFDEQDDTEMLSEGVVNESPDTVFMGNQKLYYRDEQAKPFAYWGKKFIVGDFGEGHSAIDRREKLSLRTYDGRIWTKDKIITFWQFPKQTQIKKFVNMIEKQTGLKIWNNGWKIEANTNESGDIDLHKTEKYGTLGGRTALIPLEDYSDKHVIEFDKTLHIASPLLKKKRLVPKGVGSKKIPKGGSKDEIPAKTHARMRQEEIEVDGEIEIDEEISIDVEVGDTIMTGRFKNSPTLVKSIGKDEFGMPTINGRKVVTFKKGKKRPNIFDENLFTKEWWDNILEDFNE